MEPANTVITLSDTNTIDSIADYACIGTNFLLVGNMTRTCTSNGWTGSESFCRDEGQIVYREISLEKAIATVAICNGLGGCNSWVVSFRRS